MTALQLLTPPAVALGSSSHHSLASQTSLLPPWSLLQTAAHQLPPAAPAQTELSGLTKKQQKALHKRKARSEASATLPPDPSSLITHPSSPPQSNPTTSQASSPPATTPPPRQLPGSTAVSTPQPGIPPQPEHSTASIVSPSPGLKSALKAKAARRAALGPRSPSMKRVHFALKKNQHFGGAAPAQEPPQVALQPKAKVRGPQVEIRDEIVLGELQRILRAVSGLLECSSQQCACVPAGVGAYTTVELWHAFVCQQSVHWMVMHSSRCGDMPGLQASSHSFHRDCADARRGVLANLLRIVRVQRRQMQSKRGRRR